MSEIPDSLTRCELLRELGAVELQDVLSLASVREVEPGVTVLSEGQPGDALYVVVAGSVRIVKGSESGELCRLGAGEVFGEMALLSAQPRSASVVAAEPSRLLRFDRDGFEVLLESGEPAARYLLLGLAKVLAGRLRAMTDRWTGPSEGDPG